MSTLLFILAGVAALYAYALYDQKKTEDGKIFIAILAVVGLVIGGVSQKDHEELQERIEQERQMNQTEHHTVPNVSFGRRTLSKHNGPCRNCEYECNDFRVSGTTGICATCGHDHVRHDPSNPRY